MQDLIVFLWEVINRQTKYQVKRTVLGVTNYMDSSHQHQTST